MLFRNIDAEWADRITLGRGGQMCGKDAGGTRNSDTHRGGAQKPATIMIDCLGWFGRTHRLISLPDREAHVAVRP